jgi:hypothetical protein
MLSIVSFMQRFQPPPGLPCQAGDGHAVEDEDAESQRSTLALLKIHHPTGFSKIWVAISGPQNGGTVPYNIRQYFVGDTPFYSQKTTKHLANKINPTTRQHPGASGASWDNSCPHFASRLDVKSSGLSSGGLGSQGPKGYPRQAG